MAETIQSIIKKYVAPEKQAQANQIVSSSARSNALGGTKALADMTVAEAAAAGKTAEYNALVNQYTQPRDVTYNGVNPATVTSTGEVYKPQLTAATLGQAAGTNITIPPQESPYKISEVTSAITPNAPITKTTDTKENKTAIQLWEESMSKAQDLIGNQETAYLKAEKEAGINQMKQQENELNTQITTITNRALQDEAQLRSSGAREGVTEAVYGQQYNEIARRAVIEALPLQSQLAAVQGNIKIAEERLNTLFSLKMKDAEMKYNYIRDVSDKYYDLATKEQQAAMDAKEKEDDRKFTLFRDNQNYIQNLSAKAFSDGNYELATKLGDYASKLEWNKVGTTNINSDLSSIVKGGGTEAPTVKTINGVDMQWNPSTGNWDTIGTTGVTTQKPAQLELMTKTLENVFGSTYDPKTGKFTPAKDKEQLYKYSGQSPITRTVASWGGVTPFQQLENYTNTLKTNMLTLATDPSIKKFFGPQMSNADVQLMMSGGTTLDPKNQTPEQFKQEALRIADFIQRANEAVSNGVAMESSKPEKDTNIYTDKNGVSYQQGADGLYYTIK